MPYLYNIVRLQDGTLPHCAWPGMYPLYYVDIWGHLICPTCANIADKDIDSGVARYEVNWECTHLYCDDCGAKIESAYGEDEE